MDPLKVDVRRCVNGERAPGVLDLRVDDRFDDHGQVELYLEGDNFAGWCHLTRSQAEELRKHLLKRVLRDG